MTELIARIDDFLLPAAKRDRWIEVLRGLGVDIDRVRGVFEVCRVDRGDGPVVVEVRLREFVLGENGHQQAHPDDPLEVWTKPLDVLVPDDVVLPI